MHKLFAAFCAIVLSVGLLMFLPKSVSAAQQPRYGYSLLTSDIQRTVYQEILSGVEALNPEITLSIHATENSLDSVKKEIQFAVQMVTKDCPELFWFRGAYGFSAGGTVDDIKIVVKPEYYLNGQPVSTGSSALATAKSQLETIVSEALAGIPVNASDYDIALALHDFISDRVTYLEVGDHQTAYGALVNGKAVCAGYTRAYQLLLNRAGIPCTYIHGESYSPDNMLVSHAWNLVWLDGKCYYTDVTWDDQEDSSIFHEYFNLSKEEINMTHFPSPDENLPASCGHDSYRFFIKNSGKGICDIRDHKEDTDVANCFQLKSIDGNNAVYYCTIHFHQDGFWSWYYDHLESIGFMLGFASFASEVINLGHEYHVLLEGVLSEVPTEPSVTPTEAVPTQPVESTQQIQPTQQTAKPTEPQIQPSEHPTQPSTRPTQQNVRPTETSSQPTQPSAQPTQPSLQPTQPSAQPTQPSAPPTQPGSQETQPGSKPNGTTFQPTHPAAEQNRPSNSQNPSSEPAAQPTIGNNPETSTSSTEVTYATNSTNPSTPAISKNPDTSISPVEPTTPPEESQSASVPAASQDTTEPCETPCTGENVGPTDRPDSAKSDGGSKVVTVIVSVLVASGLVSGTVFYFVNRKRGS